MTDKDSLTVSDSPVNLTTNQPDQQFAVGYDGSRRLGGENPAPFIGKPVQPNIYRAASVTAKRASRDDSSVIWWVLFYIGTDGAWGNVPVRLTDTTQFAQLGAVLGFSPADLPIDRKHSFNLQPEIHVSGGDPFYKLHEICVPTNDELIVALKAHADHVGALTAKNGYKVDQTIREYITMAATPDFNGAWKAIADLITPMEKANKASEIIKAQNAAGLEATKDPHYASPQTAEMVKGFQSDPLVDDLKADGASEVEIEDTPPLPGNGGKSEVAVSAIKTYLVKAWNEAEGDWKPYIDAPANLTGDALGDYLNGHVKQRGEGWSLRTYYEVIGVSEKVIERRARWTCEHLSGMAAIMSCLNHFKREVYGDDEIGANPYELIIRVLGTDIEESIDTRGCESTVDLLQAYIDKRFGKEQEDVTKPKTTAEPETPTGPTKAEWEAWIAPYLAKGYSIVDTIDALHMHSMATNEVPVFKFSDYKHGLIAATNVMKDYEAKLAANMPPPDNAQKSAENGATTNEAPAQPAKDEKPQAQDIPAVETTKQEVPTETKALALVKSENPLPQGLFPAPSEWQFMRDMAQAAIKSGLLPKGIKSPDAALYIIETGRELGISPALALRKIQIIQGQPTLAAELMLALVKRSGLLDYISIEGDETQCTVTMRRRGESSYVERFTMDQARKMRTSEWDENSKSSKQIPLADKFNWRTMPAVMLKWRAVSAACRTVFPDITLGIYTSEEMQDNLVLNGNTADLIIEAPAA